jgi:hypothetical protein
VALLWAKSAGELCALAAAAPKTMTLVGAIGGPREGSGEGPAVVDQGVDAAAIRALAGHVDAAIVPPSVHAAPGFAELVTELDP